MLYELLSVCATQQMSAIFRTQRVNRISFSLTAEALTALVDCENGEASGLLARRIAAGFIRLWQCYTNTTHKCCICRWQ